MRCDPWLRLWITKPFERDASGLKLALWLFPARRLMTRREEGYMVWSAFHVTIEIVWLTHARKTLGLPARPQVNIWTWSDVDKITARIAELAGQT